ncbi:MAG: hypothetical protein AB2792_09440 [Candidatus Thiodiazotropha sp.]
MLSQQVHDIELMGGVEGGDGFVCQQIGLSDDRFDYFTVLFSWLPRGLQVVCYPAI